MNNKRIQIIEAMFMRYRQGLYTDKRHIQKIADDLGIVDINWVYEVVELSWVEWYRMKVIKVQGEKGVYRSIDDIAMDVWRFYEKCQPSFTSLDSNKRIYQQYSTAALLSVLAGWFTDPFDERHGFYKSGTQHWEGVFEPSAGNGLLTIWYARNQVTANELDVTRFDNLKLPIPNPPSIHPLTYASVSQKDATLSTEFLSYHYHRHFSAVLTNPPFGPLIKSDYYIGDMKVKLDEKMTEIALSCMRYDGRAAVIVGEHTEFETSGQIRGRRTFYNWLYRHYNVVDMVNIDSAKLYAKQGTGYPLRLILIAGHKPKPFGRAPLSMEQPQLAEICHTPEMLIDRVKRAKALADIPPPTQEAYLNRIFQQLKMELQHG